VRPFPIAESLLNLHEPYPSAHSVVEAAADGMAVRMALAQLWITEGIPYAFRDRPGIYASMRAWLAGELEVHPKEISLTGSARLGESLTPQHRGTPFGPESDLDLFLVSSNFFARIEGDFLRWSNEYRCGAVTPRNQQEAKYWHDHQKRGPKIIRRGFLDAWMIPPWNQYEIGQRVANTMWLLRQKLAATPSGPVVKKASLRVYRDMKSLIDQISLSLYCATVDDGQTLRRDDRRAVAETRNT